jgi:hypothetical protein
MTLELISDFHISPALTDERLDRKDCTLALRTLLAAIRREHQSWMATPEIVFQQLYPYLWWAGEDVAAQTILHCVHAASQKAFCHLMLNDAASAKLALSTIDIGQLEELAEIILTMSTALARVLAVQRLLDVQEGRKVSTEPIDQIGKLLERSTMMLGAGADPRTSYLRQLFISLAIRDVEWIIAL